MNTFEYQGYHVTVEGVNFPAGREEWGFSVTRGGQIVRARAATDKFSSPAGAEAAARNWIDKRLHG